MQYLIETSMGPPSFQGDYNPLSPDVTTISRRHDKMRLIREMEGLGGRGVRLLCAIIRLKDSGRRGLAQIPGAK